LKASWSSLANKVTVSVRDSGMGVKNETLTMIRQDFSRIDEGEDLEVINSGNNGGIGLGLWLCHKLCQLLGDSLQISSQNERGSTFSFALEVNAPLSTSPNSVDSCSPCSTTRGLVPSRVELQNLSEHTFPKLPYTNPTKTAARTLRLPSSSKCDCPQVLIVDDEVLNLFTLSTILDKCNISHDTADNGQAALEMIQRRQSKFCCQTYKLIILDYQMPVLNGPDLLRKLRKAEKSNKDQDSNKFNQENCSPRSVEARDDNSTHLAENGWFRTPVIGFTAYGEHEAQEFLQLGAERVISKPVKLKELKEVVSKYLTVEI